MKAIIEIKCPRCNKVTKHFLSKNKAEGTGVYRCGICCAGNKKVKLK